MGPGMRIGPRACTAGHCHRPRRRRQRAHGSPRAIAPAPCAATDPDPLRWVHVAITDSFPATHRVWDGPIPGGPDAYVGEWAGAGELVDIVRNVPVPAVGVPAHRAPLAGAASPLR
ncbi:MAG: oxygenase MpaB family protein, partial [Candidatus Nanopelagicales bacterium]